MTATAPATPTGAPLPADPAAFVMAAERGVNDRDLDACVAAYADDALMESITDGAHEEHRGAEALREAWQGYLTGMDQTRFRLRKELVSAAGDTIVNTWTSTFGGRRPGRGIETWRFDEEGKVAHHVMYTFFDVRPSRSLVARLRLTVAYPRIALAFLRATGRRP